MMGRLAGKNVFITGAGAGIGRASALRFAREGATVAVAELDAATGQAAVDALSAAGGTATFIQTDVTDEESVRKAVALTVQRFGRIDMLYNNAGGSSAIDARVTDCPADEFWRKIKVDLFGTWITCKYGIAAMMESGGGSVINSSSVFSLVGTRGKDAYTAAKGGVSAITRSMAVEYAPHNIRVNAIAPAVTKTERVAGLIEAQPEIISKTSERQLLGIIQPSDVAELSLFLAGDESRMITGQIFPIDAGFSIS
jgi:NAD(P)-dependent dehydrogenase (short-subunit alcohol dehydrogenase family)